MLPTIEVILIAAFHTENNRGATYRKNKTPLIQKIEQRVLTAQIFVLSQCDAHYHTRRTVTGTSVVNLSQSHRGATWKGEAERLDDVINVGSSEPVRECCFKQADDFGKFLAARSSYPIGALIACLVYCVSEVL